MSSKILCVDDDPYILEAYKRGLRKQFRIETAPGGPEGLKTIKLHGPFAVVVSDMRMPGMDGVQFLAAVKERAPDSVRVMLTGNSDQETAIEAVNEGNIFRFLTKPCPPETLAKVLTAGVEQYRLVRAEKDLLEKTLKGAIKVLCDVLALTNPTAFGHASRARRVVRELCNKLSVKNAWQLEIAAMLSQIGCVTLPPAVLDSVYHGQVLKPDEMQMLDAHPAVGKELVANIPRLETVADIIAYQRKHFDGSGAPSDTLSGKDIPQGARILKVALDYDALKWSGLTHPEVVIELRQRAGWYDPEVLDAAAKLGGVETPIRTKEVRVRELTPAMTLAADVTTAEGTLLVGKGQEVTPSLCQRLKNFARRSNIKEPIRVFVQAESKPLVAARS